MDIQIVTFTILVLGVMAVSQFHVEENTRGCIRCSTEFTQLEHAY